LTDSDVRNLALSILIDVLEKGSFSHIAIQKELTGRTDLTDRDKKFAMYLIRGTIQRKLTLDHILGQFSKTPLKKMKPVIRTILRMSVFQIMYMDSVPDRAVCNEAVRLTKRRGLSGLSGFVNGVLRSVVRGREEIHWPDRSDDLNEYLSIWYSMPKWLVEKWIAAYGETRCEGMLRAFQTERSITVRPNPDKTDADQLQQILEKEGLICRRLLDPAYAIAISGVTDLMSIPAFRDGLFYIQDAASMHVAEYAGAKEGDLVIDVCGAPGGKSIQIAQMLHGTGTVITRDLSDRKVALIRENIQKMDLHNMQAEVWDARTPDPGLEKKADIVIADLPCSGLGVTGRKAEIRYRITQDDIDALVSLQQKILTVVSEYVKPGGALLYSTCTVIPEENEGNANWFSDTHPGFKPVMQKQYFPSDETDGFFIAKWERK